MGFVQDNPTTVVDAQGPNKVSIRSFQGLQGTARRYVHHLIASTSGREAPPPGFPEVGSSPQEAQQFEIAFTSQCEHHLLPFQGTVQVCFPLPSPHALQVVETPLQTCLATLFNHRGAPPPPPAPTQYASIQYSWRLECQMGIVWKKIR